VVVLWAFYRTSPGKPSLRAAIRSMVNWRCNNQAGQGVPLHSNFAKMAAPVSRHPAGLIPTAVTRMAAASHVVIMSPGGAALRSPVGGMRN
jgi:hypothetical protein